MMLLCLVSSVEVSGADKVLEWTSSVLSVAV